MTIATLIRSARAFGIDEIDRLANLAEAQAALLGIDLRRRIPKPRLLVKCANCGCDFTAESWRKNVKFCSMKCRVELWVGEKHPLNSIPAEHMATYRIYAAMKHRCLNPKGQDFSYYGGRGITICDRWRSSFNNFVADMGIRPSRNLTIDRIDNDGNYEPGNCRWTTRLEQRLNQPGRIISVEYMGKTMNLQELSRLTGITRGSLRRHIFVKGRPAEEVVSNFKFRR